MKERPIPFSAPMVRAVLAGTKTQTRRTRGLESIPLDAVPGGVARIAGALVAQFASSDRKALMNRPVIYKPGDQLWVREAWRADALFDGKPPRDIPQGAAIFYEAGLQEVPFPAASGKLRPAMFMCRWMSRIQLEVTGLRVERLQAISEADAIAEGAPGYEEGEDAPPPDPACEWDCRQSYRRVWESINGAGSWALNPWVWVIEFRRLKP